MNCWDFKQCKWTEECPAYPDYGSCCIAITGTLCCEHHELLEKLKSCKKCTFYKSRHFNKEKADEVINELY